MQKTHSYISKYVGAIAILTGLMVPGIFINEAMAATDNTDETVTEIDWDALVDNDWDPQALLDKFFEENNPSREELHMEIRRLSEMSPIEPSLNEKVVKLPGYIVPVEFDGTDVKEFLLVPYVGACIHVPPPPPNQVVYGKSEKKIAFDGMWTPVWVTGKMMTVSANKEIAEPGFSRTVDTSYSMDVYEVVPYEY